MGAILLWWCFWNLIAFVAAFYGSGGSHRRFALLLIVFALMASCIYFTLLAQLSALGLFA